MKEISDNKLFILGYKISIFLAIEFIIASIVLGFLPMVGIENRTSDITDITYTKYTLYNFNKKQSSQQDVIEVVQSIDGFKLKAIINQPDGGTIIIEDGGVSHLLSKNEEYKGYRLTLIKNKYVIFEKDNEKFTLKLLSQWDDDTTSTNLPSSRGIEVSEQSTFTLKKESINEYVKNPKQIWKNISIAPYKEGGKLVGYKVYKVVKGSVFEQLGIKKDDIITKANNVELKSNKDAIELYKKIDEIKNIMLTVVRDNQEMELEYEIN